MRGVRPVVTGRHRVGGARVSRLPLTTDKRGTVHPLWAALALPPSVLALMAGGALGSFGWLLLLGIVLILVGVVGLLWAAVGVLPAGSRARAVAGVLLAGPMFATTLLPSAASHAYVLHARGASRPAAVVRVVEYGGRSTTYECFLRYDGRGGGPAGAPGSVRCGRHSRSGEHIRVVWDPEGLVQPESAGAVTAGRRDAELAGSAALLLTGTAGGAVAIGTVLRVRARRRARTEPTAPAGR